MASLYLIRHGQASFGSANYDQLSDLGMQQCLLLGQWMRQTNQPVEQIVLGEMHRHRQSAQAFMNGFGAAAHLHEQHWQLHAGLNEFDHEQLLQKSRPEFADTAQLMQFLSSQLHPRATLEKMFVAALSRWMISAHDSDYAETWTAFQARVGSAIHSLTTAAGSSPKHTIVFTSGGPISVICQQLLAIPDTHFQRLLAALLNSGVSKLVYGDGQLKLVGMNAVGHLEQHNDSSLLSYR